MFSPFMFLFPKYFAHLLEKFYLSPRFHKIVTTNAGFRTSTRTYTIFNP